jgi:hypothetical protein
MSLCHRQPKHPLYARRSALRPIGLSLLAISLLGCAQSISYSPSPITASYTLNNFSRANTRVIVKDLRAQRDGSSELISAIQNQIERALAGGRNSGQYVITIDVIEHRSYFTMGNWNALTRLRWRVQRGNGSIIREGQAIGEGHRSNMLGYATANAVSQDAFDAAMADLLSALSSV